MFTTQNSYKKYKKFMNSKVSNKNKPALKAQLLSSFYGIFDRTVLSKILFPQNS